MAWLDIEDEGGGEVPELGFKDRISIWGMTDDFGCMADEDLLVYA